MNIIYFHPWYPTMNDTFVAREILEITKAGHNVSICVLQGKKKDYAYGIKEIESERINIVKVKFNPIKIFLNLLKVSFRKPNSFIKCLIELIMTCFRQPKKFHHYFYIFFSVLYFYNHRQFLKIKYIHTHFLHSGAIAARWFSIMSNIPYGFTAHIAKIRYESNLIKKVINDSKLSIGDTEETLKFMENLTGRKGGLIKNSIDVNSIRFSDRNISQEMYQTTFILACGALIPPKGFDVLVKACCFLFKEDIKVICRIIGEGPERNNLEKIGKDLIDKGLLELPGALPIDELFENYGKVNIFVMPSVPTKYGRDGLPTVIIEAMACGIPVIGTKHAAIPELVIHNETGLLVEPNDPIELAKAIKKLINDKELRKKTIIQARKKIEEEYNIEINIKRFLNLIQNSNSP